VAVVLALLPVSLMPDAIWGVGGRLDAVSYPASYERAREAVTQAPPGAAVSLPFESYRAPTWNGGRRVLDPLGRFLGRTTVVNDVLVVSGRPLVGEDPVSSAVARALGASSPSARSAALRAAGVSVVVAEDIAGYPSPEVAGEAVLDGDLRVTVVGPAEQREISDGRAAAVGVAWAAWLAVLVWPLLHLWGRRRRVVTRQ
jgi:hypothetical protein